VPDPASPEKIVELVKAAHTDERLLIDTLTEEKIRVTSPMPGWTRGHLLSCRLVFLRSALRPSEAAREGRTIAFYQDGPDPRAADRAGRDAEFEATVGRPAAELVGEVQRATVTLDQAWSRLGPSDWARPARYRGRGTLLDVLFACWRESEVHMVDYQLGARPADWSAEFCVHLLDYLARRVPKGLRLELTADENQTWSLGQGDPVRVRGALTDLAAWLGGRELDGPLQSSTGVIPDLGLGNAAQLAG
jgi:maleylpyruvate isomerase